MTLGTVQWRTAGTYFERAGKLYGQPPGTVETFVDDTKPFDVKWWCTAAAGASVPTAQINEATKDMRLVGQIITYTTIATTGVTRPYKPFVP